MLKADGLEPGPVNAINSIDANNLITQPASPNSLGDEILARLDAVGANYKQNVNRAYAALEKSPRENTVQDLIKMQLDIAVVSLEVEVVGKGVQKSVQHIDTLSKMN
jgi:type III secretion protein I